MQEPMKLWEEPAIIAEAARCAIAAAEHLIEVLHTVGGAGTAAKGLAALPPHTVGRAGTAAKGLAALPPHTVGRAVPCAPQEQKEEKRKEEVRQEEEEKEKKAPPPPPARGRARVSEAILKKWKIEPLFVQYWSEEIDNDSIKDPDKHIKNCWTHRGSDKSWQEYKRLHPNKATVAPKVYKPEDWQLCRERCQHCGENGCTRGVRVPPDHNPNHIHIPEECADFNNKKEESK